MPVRRYSQQANRPARRGIKAITAGAPTIFIDNYARPLNKIMLYTKEQAKAYAQDAQSRQNAMDRRQIEQNHRNKLIDLLVFCGYKRTGLNVLSLEKIASIYNKEILINNQLKQYEKSN